MSNQLSPVQSGAARAAWQDELLAVGLTLIGLMLAIVLAVRADNATGFYHDDDITHYLFAHKAWEDPKAMWHDWARPGYNIPTMFAARLFGLLGTRIFSALQTALVAYLSWRIARRIFAAAGLPRWAAACAPLFVWLQPLTLVLATTTLTETTAAVYLSLAAWLYLRGNRLASAVCFSLLFVTRVETMGLIPVMAALVIHDAGREAGWRVPRLLKTRWAWGFAALLLWAPLVQVIAARLAGLPHQSNLTAIFSKQYSAEYGNGSWAHFLIQWLYQASAGVVALAAAGSALLGRRGLLVSALTAGLVGLHTLIYHYGLFASGGYGRFLVPLSGLVAVLAAAAVGEAARKARQHGLELVYLVIAAALLAAPEYITDNRMTMEKVLPLAAMMLVGGMITALSRTTRLAVAGGVLAVVAGIATAGVQWREMFVNPNIEIAMPLRMATSPLNMAVMQCVQQAHQRGLSASPALTTHVLVPLLHPNAQPVAGRADGLRRWQESPPGTLFFWDFKYGGNADEPLYCCLRAHGQCVGSYWDEWTAAEVYIRTDDSARPAASQSAPSTLRSSSATLP